MLSTNNDTNQWLIADAPTHFREWDAGVVHPLPPQLPQGDSRTIGSAEDCWLRLRDPTRRVSRHHAKLTHDCEGRLVVADLRSKNGITQDGSRQVVVPVVPGLELGIGGVTLIIESPLIGLLRELLARLIGWSDERRLNLALRSVRLAATRRESLQLCADDNRTLLSVARLLHRRTLGVDRPFIICARRPAKAPEKWAKWEGTPRYEHGLEALAAANGGTLCVGPRPPHDFGEVIEAHRDPSSRVQLIVCTRTPHHDPLITPVVLPSMSERGHELDRIIEGYAVDAGATPGKTLKAADLEWIRAHESATLAQIETATLRFVMMRRHKLTHAAELLGMSHGSLSEWIADRTLDISVEGDDDDDAP